jgi:Leucine-rich repeat (LRR) protein
VLLYELLTGRTPIEQGTLARVGLDEIRRIIREVDPPRPSQRVKTLNGAELTAAAKRRNIEPAKFPGTLHGDLDWIVMKCLEKDRSRRYETANGLARDLQHHLASEAVTARPPTATYLLGRLLRRNKFGFAAGAAIAASLIIGIATSMWQAVRANREAKRAVALLGELRETAPAFAEQARALVARERFDEAIEKLTYAAKLRPDAAEFLIAKGDLLQCQFRFAEAAATYQAALRNRPDDARAKASALLCDELIAAPFSEDGKLTRQGLSKLHLAMQHQQRPAAELMTVARQLGEENKHIVAYWLGRLKDLPISADRPLKERLTVRDDGLLALDLSETKVTDLAPLIGAPLAVLNAAGASELSNIESLRAMKLIELNLARTKVADLSPLRGSPTLQELLLAKTPVFDLSPLEGMRLKRLDITGCPVTDISPLRMAALEEILIRGTRVTDISPLAGMPLRRLDMASVPVLNFEPLSGLPLEVCNVAGCQLLDLTVLRRMPLRELVLWNCISARNYWALREIKTLELLILSDTYPQLPDEELAMIESLRNHPSLRQLGAEAQLEMNTAVTGSKDAFWENWDREKSYFAAVRNSGFRYSLSRLANGTYSLSILHQPLRDLSILKGAPISRLSVVGCQVEDLTPIGGLPIEFLQISSNPVADLSPLRGMPLKSLYLQKTKVSDLSPLTQLPLKSLFLHSCDSLADVSDLAKILTLENVTVPIHAGNTEALQNLPHLRGLAFNSADKDSLIPESTAAEFWKETESGWVLRLCRSGVKVNMLKRVKDGTWWVNLDHSQISDLNILSGAPISSLSLGGTVVADLNPLRGMPLKQLGLWDTNVTDLSPLKGMPLEILHLSGTKVADLTPLHGISLVELWLIGCNRIVDLSPLAEAKRLRTLALPPTATKLGFLRSFPDLQRIGFESRTSRYIYKTPAEFWREYEQQRWISALHELGVKISALSQLDDGTWSLDIGESTIEDLSILRGAPISVLWLHSTAVHDLVPLRGMPLKKLGLYNTKVTDLSPLQGMQLKYLNLIGTAVADLTPLRGMPLESMRLNNCLNVVDLSPLAGATTLTEMTLPPNAKDFDFLRSFPNLERLSFKEDPSNLYLPDKTAAEFWKEYDARQK